MQAQPSGRVMDKKRRVVARVERHPGERVPRVGFIVTRLSRPARHVVAFCNRHGAAGTSRSSPVGPVGRGRGARGPVRRDPAADRRTSAAAGAGVTRLVVMQSGKNHGEVCPDDDEIGNPGAIYAGVTVLLSLDPHDDGPGLQMSARGGNIGSTMAVIP